MEELTTGYQLIEGPLWDPARGLFFSDVLGGGVYLLGSDGEVETVLPERKGVGGLAFHEDGGLIVTGRGVAYLPPGGGDLVTLLAPNEAQGEVFFNDLMIDAEGRIYAGSLGFDVFEHDAERDTGTLERIDLDGSAHLEAEGIELTNGLGFSPDRKRLYHADSSTHAIWVYGVGSDGALRAREVFAHLGEKAMPDGLAVAEDGSVWIADANGGRVAVVDADGSHREDIAVPLPMVTSLCFGGKDLRDLYVVTGSWYTEREDAGTIFRTNVDVAGLPRPVARTRLP